jgi:hypothetical protein
MCECKLEPCVPRVQSSFWIARIVFGDAEAMRAEREAKHAQAVVLCGANRVIAPGAGAHAQGRTAGVSRGIPRARHIK